MEWLWRRNLVNPFCEAVEEYEAEEQDDRGRLRDEWAFARFLPVHSK